MYELCLEQMPFQGTYTKKNRMIIMLESNWKKEQVQQHEEYMWKLTE